MEHDPIGGPSRRVHAVPAAQLDPPPKSERSILVSSYPLYLYLARIDIPPRGTPRHLSATSTISQPRFDTPHHVFCVPLAKALVFPSLWCVCSPTKRCCFRMSISTSTSRLEGIRSGPHRSQQYRRQTQCSPSPVSVEGPDANASSTLLYRSPYCIEARSWDRAFLGTKITLAVSGWRGTSHNSRQGTSRPCFLHHQSNDPLTAYQPCFSGLGLGSFVRSSLPPGSMIHVPWSSRVICTPCTPSPFACPRSVLLLLLLFLSPLALYLLPPVACHNEHDRDTRP